MPYRFVAFRLGMGLQAKTPLTFWGIAVSPWGIV